MQIQKVNNSNQKISCKGAWIKASEGVINENFFALKKMTNKILGDEFNFDPAKRMEGKRILPELLTNDEYKGYNELLVKKGVKKSENNNDSGDILFNASDVSDIKKADKKNRFSVVLEKVKSSMEIFPSQIEKFYENIEKTANIFGLK